MNCIPGSGHRAPAASGPFLPRAAGACLGLALLFALAACVAAAAQTSPVDDRVYDVLYTVTPDPAGGTAAVELSVRQPRHLLRELSMEMPTPRYRDIAGDGEIRRDGERLTWLPPQEGGSLRWTAEVNHIRYGDAYDAWLGPDWALLRGTDIMPPARTRTLRGARSRTVLRFDLPRGWSSITQYRERDGQYRVDNDERRFDRPAGWMLLGKIGVRIETISGVRVLVGGPTGQDVRRMDMLALLNWTLPQVLRILPDFPRRLTIVSASDSMWRGGLSGPRSLYLHAGLPLISENATSALLHEIMHIGLGIDAARGADWIVEGLAEYYGLEVLRRSRTISAKRFAEAIEEQAEWGRRSGPLCSGESTAATTARAVGVFAELHAELRESRPGANPLDEVVRRLAASDRKVTVAGLRRIATAIDGRLPDTLSAGRLPGCK